MPMRMPKAAIQLTPRQVELLQAIASFQTNRCYSPTIAELACELGTSRSTAFEHIGELRRKGLIFTRPGKARSLQLSIRALELLERINGGRSDGCAEVRGGIALSGKVAAGLPIEAVEQTEYLSLASQFGGTEEIFALEVCGQSMVEDDIRDGDYIICRRARTAEDGQLVIAILDDKNATLKRFYKEKSWVRLEPSNAAYEAIYSAQCRIEAVVIGLLRKF